ncbi:hypothetical protein PIB30_096803, partial [Stylosanthes scabra]|nr:hypothetical protein [Stylosanthes scabra]
VNPKEECKAVVLRSGKVLEESSKKIVGPQKNDQTVEDSLVTFAVNGPSPIKPTSIPSSSSIKGKDKQIPFPQRLQKEVKD